MPVQDHRKFGQRFYEYVDYYQVAKGPVFLKICGESACKGIVNDYLSVSMMLLAISDSWLSIFFLLLLSFSTKWISSSPDHVCTHVSGRVAKGFSDGSASVGISGWFIVMPSSPAIRRLLKLLQSGWTMEDITHFACTMLPMLIPGFSFWILILMLSSLP